MTNLRKLLTVFILGTLLISCEKGEMKQEMAAAPAADVQVNSNGNSNEPLDRKIIKNGNLTFQAEDLAGTRQRILSATKSLGGYVSKDNQNTLSHRIQNEMEVRVPVQNFETLVENIASGVDHFENKELHANDVTAEFVDLEARIKTKKELEQRYLELLAKANTVKDMLEIEQEIGNLRTEIERMEGSLKLMSDRVAMSTLSIRFYREIPQTTQFNGKFSDGFQNGWENLLWFLLGLVNLWPFLLIIVPAVIFYLRNRKRKKKLITN